MNDKSWILEQEVKIYDIKWNSIMDKIPAISLSLSVLILISLAFFSFYLAFFYITWAIIGLFIAMNLIDPSERVQIALALPISIWIILISGIFMYLKKRNYPTLAKIRKRKLR